MENQKEPQENKIIWKTTPQSEEEEYSETIHHLSELEGLELIQGIEEAKKTYSEDRLSYSLSILAGVAYREANFKRTIALYKEIFKLKNPEFEEMYYEFACSYLAIKDYENAKKIICKANELFPESELCDDLNIQMLESQGKYLEAIKIHKKLYLSDPKEPQFVKAYFSSLAFYEYFIKNNFEKAVTHLKEMLKNSDDEEIKDEYEFITKILEIDKDIKKAIREASTFDQLTKKLEPIKVKAKRLREKYHDYYEISENPPSNEDPGLTSPEIQFVNIIESIQESIQGKGIDKHENLTIKKECEQAGMLDIAKFYESINKFNDYARDLCQYYPKGIPKAEQKKAILILKTISDLSLISFLSKETRYQTEENLHSQQIEAPAKTQQEKEPYEIFLSDPSGIGTEEISATEEEHKKYRENRDKYDIFIYHGAVYVKGKKEPIDLELLAYNLLIIFLRYKNKPLPPIPLYRKIKLPHYKGKITDNPEEIYNKYLKPSVSNIRKALFSIKKFCIKKTRLQPITCSGEFSFCIILSKEEAKKYYLDEGETTETEEAGFE